MEGVSQVDPLIKIFFCEGTGKDLKYTYTLIRFQVYMYLAMQRCFSIIIYCSIAWMTYVLGSNVDLGYV